MNQPEQALQPIRRRINDVVAALQNHNDSALAMAIVWLNIDLLTGPAHLYLESFGKVAGMPDADRQLPIGGKAAEYLQLFYDNLNRMGELYSRGDRGSSDFLLALGTVSTTMDVLGACADHLDAFVQTHDVRL